MSVASFEAALSELVASLGDATRRAIYLDVRDAAEPRSAADVAEAFGVHANVARYHLDHLVEAGYLTRHKSGTGASGGRPAHLYQATGREIHLDLPTQSFELLARLLAQVLQRIPSSDVTDLAYQVGLSHGQEIAASAPMHPSTDVTSAVREVAEIMSGLGFGTRFSAVGAECGYTTTHCPFGRVALENPRIVCALDRGLVTGLLEAIDMPVEITVAPHTRLAEPCTTVVTAVT